MISLEEIESKFVSNDNKVINLKNLNISIGSNETIAIIGKTNADRTAIIRSLAFLDKPTSGSYKFEKFNFTELAGTRLVEARKYIGYVNLERTLLNSKNVLQNIASILIINNVPKNIWVNKANDIIAMLNLNNISSLYPNQLTKLQKVMVCIGRALIINPKLLLCDDITYGLESKSSIYIANKINDIKNKFNLSIVLATNDLELIKNTSDRVMVTNKGKIIESANAIKLFLNPRSTIGKEFIKAKARMDLPLSIRSKLKANDRSSKKESTAVVRCAFESSNNPEQILGEIIEQHSAKVNIISAHSEFISDSEINLMLIELESEFQNINKSISLLNENQVYTEVLGYV